MRPLTLTRAKPVVPLCNRPFLAWQLALLREHGVDDVVLSCSYRVDDLRSALGEETFGVKLRYVIEVEPLGTGGGVRNAADIARGHVFVLNGDILTDADLGAMRRFHEARDARVTIFLTPVPDPRQYGLVETSADGRIRSFREKPAAGEAITTDTINAGIYLIDAELLHRMPVDRAVSIEREFFPALIADGVPCYGWAPAVYWRDIGNIATYREAQMDLLDGRVRVSLSPPGEGRGGVWLAPGATLAPDAHVRPPVAIGEGARVGPGAAVGPRAVLGPGCVVAAGATVEEAVLWERVEVGPRAVLRGCVVVSDARIGAGAEIGAGVVVESGAVVADHARP
ncbi:MAG TPA: NDP-sugar synthase, partial [Methylomirabilota bacterium]|nr:NDP-sugar synthase [Methylomirabilota bacterium]